MPINTFYNEILTDHNLHPAHKHNLDDANLVLEGVNPSCGDDIVLQLKMNDDGVIEDGKKKEEALELADIFLRMIKGEITDEEKERLEEASSLEDISHMPSRVKCAVLGWHTMEELVEKHPKEEK